MIVEFKKLNDKAKMPFHGSLEAACSDVFSCFDSESEFWELLPGETKVVPTGLKVAYIPKGYRIGVYSRSGLSAKNSVFVLNAPGIVDSDYRGELKVILHNSGKESFTIENEMRIAQIALEKIEDDYTFRETTTDGNETERGNGGFGSTGF